MLNSQILWVGRDENKYDNWVWSITCFIVRKGYRLRGITYSLTRAAVDFAGVMTEASAPEETRVIQFPKGEYLVVKGEAKSADELNNMLTGIAFGQVLPEANDFAYVGAPNTMVEKGQRSGLIFGEMWIPVIRK